MAGNSKIKMYGAPWCPDCRRAKQFFTEHRIDYEWYDIDQDPKAREYVSTINKGKHIIPTILFPDGSILVEPSDGELAEKTGLTRRAQREVYDVIIVGGGPAGLTSGIYTSREGLKTLIIERDSIGGQAAITREIENYPGFVEPIGGTELADRLKKQAERLGVEILLGQGTTSVYQDGQNISVKTQRGDEYCAPAIIVATGSAYRKLNVPGEAQLIGAGVHFCATCDGPFYKGKDIVVVGGGNSGFQEGLFLTKFAKSVTILELAKEVRASKALQDKVASRKDTKVLTETTIQEFKGKGKLESIVVKDVATGRTKEMKVGAVFVFIGLRPNTEFLKGTVELDQYGFVVTNEHLESSVPGIFAAGDCRKGSTKQVTSAVGEGATAALMVREYLERRGEKARVAVEEAVA